MRKTPMHISYWRLNVLYILYLLFHPHEFLTLWTTRAHITSLLFSRISCVGSRPRNCWLPVTVESFYLKPVGQNLLDTTGLLLVPWRKWMKQLTATVQSFNFRLGWLGRAKAKLALGWWRVEDGMPLGIDTGWLAQPLPSNICRRQLRAESLLQVTVV